MGSHNGYAQLVIHRCALFKSQHRTNIDLNFFKNKVILQLVIIFFFLSSKQSLISNNWSDFINMDTLGNKNIRSLCICVTDL